MDRSSVGAKQHTEKRGRTAGKIAGKDSCFRIREKTDKYMVVKRHRTKETRKAQGDCGAAETFSKILGQGILNNQFQDRGVCKGP